MPHRLSSDPARAEQIRADITARLGGVCAHWPEAEFDELVRAIADVTLRYEDRPLSPPVTNASPDGGRPASR
jgi:hypothetical protein